MEGPRLCAWPTPARPSSPTAERFSIHLDDHPDDAQRIRSSVALLNTALGRDDASISRERGQSLSEDEKTAEHLSQRRGIKP